MVEFTKFWIIRGRQTSKEYLGKCVRCKIVQGKTIKPPDCPSLPKFRLECNHEFENVGLDCAGRLFIKDKGISYYLLGQLLEQCTRNYGQALVLLFLFKLSEDFHHIADC